MPLDSPQSIAEGSGAARARRVSLAVFVLATVVSVAAAIYYASLGLTLSHYDARGHLVVARRVFDSLTPGWRQIGAVWLPLPHLIDIPTVWSDWGYRTGYPATAVSLLMLAVGLAAFSSRLYATSQSTVAALTVPLVVLTNPNLLYLASTPMTEPLLIGLSLLAVAALDRWLAGDRPHTAQVGAILGALAWTRYEGWLVATALVGIGFIGTWPQRPSKALPLAASIATAIAAFLVLGYATTGSWFVTSGFFNPDPATLGDIVASTTLVWTSTIAIAGWTVTLAGALGAVACLARLRRPLVPMVATLALLAVAALPLYAFYQGHPHRIRYMVPIAAASGALACVAIATLPRLRHQVLAALILLVGAWLERPPLDSHAPMVLEAQWETPFRLGRTAVTTYLVREFDDTPILASMGSLGHYMQETSHAGFRLRDFLHEGNGDLWAAAKRTPARHVNWVLMEERAEGGDELAQLARQDPSYLRSFTRVVDGGGLVLYRRTSPKQDLPE